MYTEIQAAVSFLSSLLYNKLPRRKVNLFAEQLANYLLLKYQNHWYVEEPQKGSAFRCIHISQTGVTDALIAVAAQAVGLEYDDLLQNLPPQFAIFVDPGEVSYKVGACDMSTILYSADPDKMLMHQLNSLSLLDPHANQQSSLSQATTPSGESSINSLCPSPFTSSSPSPTNVSRASESPSPPSAGPAQTHLAPSNHHQPPQQQSAAHTPEFTTAIDAHNAPVFEVTSANDIKFTVGMFAQTRFGTTKLKRREAAQAAAAMQQQAMMGRPSHGKYSVGAMSYNGGATSPQLVAPPSGLSHSLSVPHNMAAALLQPYQQQQHQPGQYVGSPTSPLCNGYQPPQRSHLSAMSPNFYGYGNGSLSPDSHFPTMQSHFANGMSPAKGGHFEHHFHQQNGSDQHFLPQSQQQQQPHSKLYGSQSSEHIPLFARPTSLTLRKLSQQQQAFQDQQQQQHQQQLLVQQQFEAQQQAQKQQLQQDYEAKLGTCGSFNDVLSFDSRYWESA